MAESTSTQDQQQQILFMQLVLMFQTAAMQQMGKLMNPLTKQVERDLEQARASIDMLAMLKEKTKGNLTDDEARLIDHILFELRMNYVDEVRAEQEKAQAESRPADSAEGKTEQTGSP